jgi:DNA-binding response OmpR family regulator
MNNDLLMLKNKTVLFAEDDRIIKEQITEVLEMLFAKVLVAGNGQEAYELYEDERPQIIITDIKMPVMDGLSLVEKVRSKDYETPIILLTSFAEQELLVHAANLSIDGYILKPVELNTLTTAINKAMKRTRKDEGLIPLGKQLFFHTSTQELYKNGVVVQLGVKELELLRLLIENRSRTVTKDEISENLWPLESICESSIKNLVLRLRKKIDDDLIISVRGIGYRLNTCELGD